MELNLVENTFYIKLITQSKISIQCSIAYIKIYKLFSDNLDNKIIQKY